jgi:large subunit ribosomal protein L25
MLEGIIRESTDKKVTKALKRDGYLIANLYGKGLENINAAFKTNEFIRYVRNKDTLAFDVKVGDKTCKVVIQGYQKNPITNELIHVDLIIAQPGVETNYMIPIKTVGIAKGLKNKGVLVFHRRRLKVKCAIENLPNDFTFDVTEMDVGDTKLIRDIDMPEGVITFIEGRVPLVGIIKAK